MYSKLETIYLPSHIQRFELTLTGLYIHTYTYTYTHTYIPT